MGAPPNYKRPEDLTPTEQFVLAHGTPEQKSALGFSLESPVKPYDPKVDYFGKPLGAPLTGAPSVTGQVIGAAPEPSTYEEFKARLADAQTRGRQFRAEHPAVNAYINTAASGLPQDSMLGMGARAIDAATSPSIRQPTSFTRETPQPILPEEGRPWTAGAPAIGDSTGASPWSLPEANAPTKGGVAAPGRTGLGSDKALQNAQQDQIAGSQAIVDKKLEEGAAQVDFLNAKASAEQQTAFLRQTYAEALKRADDAQVKDEEDYAQKTADAREKAAKLGVDPGRHFRGRETQSTITLALGGAISGIFGALMGTTDNAFVNTIRNTVQDDIKSQEREIDQAWKKVAGMETTYQNLVKRGVDKRVANADYYGHVLDANIAQLNAALAKARIPAEKANIEGAIQSLQNERSALDVQMQAYWKNVYERRSAAAAASAAATAERLWRHKIELEELRIKQQNADTQRIEAEGKTGAARGTTQKDLNGAFFSTRLDQTKDGTPVQVGIVAADPTARKELTESARAHETTMKAIAEIRRLRGSGPREEGKNAPAGGPLGRLGSKTTPLTLGWERGVTSESSALKASLNKGAGLGAYDNGTAQLLEARVGELTSVGRAGDELLDQLEVQAQRDYQSHLDANGGRPAVRAYNRDTKTWEGYETTPDGGSLRAPAGRRGVRPRRPQDAVMPVDLQPGEVPVVGTDGELYAVPEAGVGEAIRQGGRVATSQDLQEHAYGGIGGQAAAAGLGALETATMGGSSAVAGEYGVLTGGQERRRSIEEEIKQYERTNPISHVLGQAAPLLLMPEMAPEMGSVVAGESAAARALNFAVPRFIEGVAQDAWLQGSQGISEDALNHDFTGQSFLAHAADPSVLLGGVANVGAGAIAHGAGKLLGGGARSAEALGAAGRFASEDARSAEAVIAATQRSGRTSDEASAMFSRVQDLAQQAAADPTREGLIEKMARAYNRAQSGGSREVERALNRSFDEALDRFAGAERVLDRTTKEAVGHSDELLKGLAKLNDLQFGLKEQNVQKLIDVSRFTEQADRALQMRQEVRAYLESAVQGVDVRTPETKRLWDTVAKVDSEVGNAIEMKLAALGTPREERALREAAARMYVALDDGKRVIGRSAKLADGRMIRRRSPSTSTRTSSGRCSRTRTSGAPSSARCRRRRTPRSARASLRIGATSRWSARYSRRREGGSSTRPSADACAPSSASSKRPSRRATSRACAPRWCSA